MLFVSCQLLKCSRGVSWNWGCAFGRSTESPTGAPVGAGIVLEDSAASAQATTPDTGYSILAVPPATSGLCSGITGWFCPKEDPKASTDAVWALSRPGQRMTWRPELSHGAGVQSAWVCPELLQGSKWAEGFTVWGSGRDACTLLCSLTGRMEVQHRQWSSPSSTGNLLQSPPPSPCGNKCNPPAEGSICSLSTKDKS